METTPSALSEINQDQINNKDKDPLEQVNDLIDVLDVLDRTYFSRDRQKKIKVRMDEALALLESKPFEFIQNKKEKA